MPFLTSNWLKWVLCYLNVINACLIFNFKQELKGEKAYSQLRAARNDARIVGIRLKQKSAEKDEKKPAAGDD